MVFFRIRPAAGRQGKVLVDSRIFFLSKDLKFDFWQQTSIPPLLGGQQTLFQLIEILRG